MCSLIPFDNCIYLSITVPLGYTAHTSITSESSLMPFAVIHPLPLPQSRAKTNQVFSTVVRRHRNVSTSVSRFLHYNVFETHTVCTNSLFLPFYG